MVWLRLYHGAAAPGLTCEVHNTDAEGRFVVGDGCSYLARELGVKTLIDSATLTGHSSFTGANHCAMMTNDEDMEVTGLASGLQSGETGTFSHIACVASAGSMRCICWEHNDATEIDPVTTAATMVVPNSSVRTLVCMRASRCPGFPMIFLPEAQKSILSSPIADLINSGSGNGNDPHQLVETTHLI